MLFLQVDPLNVWLWWNELVKKKLNPSSLYECLELEQQEVEDITEQDTKCEIDCTVLLQALRCFVWRTSKKDVRDQIAIPTQYIHVRKLKLSPIEAHFYNMKKTKCAKRAHLLWTMDSSSMLDQIDKNAAKKVILSLRQENNFPQSPSFVKVERIRRERLNSPLYLRFKSAVFKTCVGRFHEKPLFSNLCLLTKTQHSSDIALYSGYYEGASIKLNPLETKKNSKRSRTMLKKSKGDPLVSPGISSSHSRLSCRKK